MSIVCGTDFSEGSIEAVAVAAAWARRRNEPLVLVHAGADAGAHDRLEALLASAGGAPSATLRVVEGSASTALIDESRAPGTSMVIVGAVGRRGEPGWLGGTAERVARGAEVMTVAVRDRQRLLSWLDAGEPLRVFAAVDGSQTGARCVAWMSELAKMGPVTPMLGHVVWPPEEHERLGLTGPVDLVALHPAVKESVEQRMGVLAAGYTGPGEVALEIRVGWGRVADHLAHLAAEVQSDLTLVALRRRGAFDRLWRGSSTHGLLTLADGNVGCVPVAD
jgi:nucleotide-binding universal stress UspA family protein